MAIHPYEERWQAKPKIGTGNGEFKTTDLATNGARFLYHAVHVTANGTVRLATDGDRVDGSFVSFDGDGSESNTYVVYSFQQQGMRFRNGTTDGAISPGAKIVGAERAVTVGGEAQGTGESSQRYGYVKAFTPDAPGNTEANIETALTDQLKARGRVMAPVGSTHGTAATYPPADVIVSFGFE